MSDGSWGERGESLVLCQSWAPCVGMPAPPPPKERGEEAVGRGGLGYEGDLACL